MVCSKVNFLIEPVDNKWKDVIIVGQGLAGTVLAKELIDNNIDFTLVNRHAGNISSFVAAGIFNPIVFKRLTLSWYAAELIPTMFDLYRSMEQLLNQPFLHQMPLIKLLNQQELGFWKKKASTPSIADHIISLNTAPKFTGINSFDAYAEIGPAGYVKLRDMILRFTQYLIDKGKYTEDEFDYKKLIIKKDGVEWNGYKARKMIFCQGVRSQENPYFSFVPFYPVLGELLRISTNRLEEDKILHKNCFILPQGNHEFIVGATYQWSYQEVIPTQQGRTELFEKLQDILDHIPQVKDFYAGVRPTIKDRRPILGFHPDHNVLGIFNGLGTRGVMLAPFFAREMTKLLINPDYEIIPEVRLERFIS